MCRHLVWEDGYCGHTSCPVGSEPSEALPSDTGCSVPAADTICSLLTELWRRRFMSLDKGKQPQPISFFSSLPHIWLDEIFTIFGWLPHLFFVRMQCSPLYCFLDSWRVCLCFISGRTVGRAAFSGNHQWIVHGTANGHGLSSEVRTVLECFPSEFWSEINANPISVLSGSILLPPHLKHCGG